MKKIIIFLLMTMSFIAYSQQVITNVKFTDNGVIYQLDNNLITSYECNIKNNYNIYTGTVLKKGDSVLLTNVNIQTGFFESKPCLCIESVYVNEPFPILYKYAIAVAILLVLSFVIAIICKEFLFD